MILIHLFRLVVTSASFLEMVGELSTFKKSRVYVNPHGTLQDTKNMLKNISKKKGCQDPKLCTTS